MRIKLSIQHKLILAMLTVSLISVGLSIGISVRRLTDTVFRQSGFELKNDVQTVNLILNLQQTRARTSAEKLALDGDLQQAILTEDQAVLSERAAQVMSRDALDYLVISDAHGIVLVRGHDPDRAGDDVSERKLVAPSLTGLTIETITATSDKPLVAAAGVPVFELEPPHRLLGVIVAGHVLDDAFVHSLKQTIGDDVSFIIDGERLYTTLPGNSPLPDELLRESSTYQQISINNQTYDSIYAILMGNNGENVGLLEISRTQAAVRAAVTDTVGTTFMIMTAVEAVLLAATIWLGTRLTNPLASLTRAAQALGHGDYSARVDITSHDELGTLAAVYNQMADDVERTHLQLAVQAQIINQIHDAVVSTDLDGMVTSWNKGAERLFGYSTRQALGQHISFVYPEDQHRFLKNDVIAPLLERGNHAVEVTMQRQSGERFFAHLALSLLREPDGTPKGMIGYSADITERKSAEQKLAQRTERLQILRQIDQAILSAQSPAEITASALHHLRRIVPSRHAAVIVFDRDDDQASVLAINSDDDVYEASVNSSDTQSPERKQRREKIIHELKALIDRNMDQHQQLQFDGRSFISVPMVVQDRVIGSVRLEALDPGGFDEESVEVVREVTGQIAIALHQSHLRERIRRQALELEQRVAERTRELSEANANLKREIEERKQAEAAEREQRTLTSALRDSTAALSKTLDLNEVLDHILESVGRVVPHDVANIMLIEDGVARIVRNRGYAQHGVAPAVLAQDFEVGELIRLRNMDKQGRPFVVSDTSEFAEWLRLHGLTRLRSYAGAPIRWNDTIVGILNLESAEPDFYNQQHADLLEAFADHAAIAIRNAQLYGQAQELAAMKERQRLTRDLHDAVSQTLWSASILADILPAQWEQDVETGRRQLKRLSQLTRGALAEMRTLLLEQLPATLTEVNLVELLQYLADSAAGVGALQTGVSIEGDCQPTAEVQMAFYRIAQEALNNVIRHAEASHITIIGRCSPNSVELTITDDGRGFDPASHRPGHLGLSIMEERAEAVGAYVHISGQPGHGTQVTITWVGENGD